MPNQPKIRPLNDMYFIVLVVCPGSQTTDNRGNALFNKPPLPRRKVTKSILPLLLLDMGYTFRVCHDLLF